MRKRNKNDRILPFIKNKKEIVFMLGNYVVENFFHNYKEFDLCKECTGELENWLKSQK